MKLYSCVYRIIVNSHIFSHLFRTYYARKRTYENEEDFQFGAGNPDGRHAFADDVAGYYFYDAVRWAVENGITSGTTPTTFSPGRACSREQMVTFLWRAAGSPAPKITSCPFTDVDPTEYYYTAVLWAYENGVTSGVSEDTFGVDRPVTRGQMVTFLWRMAGKPEPNLKTSPFYDLDENEFYYKAVLWAYENGITTGMGDGMFMPDGTCTRGQIVTFLYRFFNRQQRTGF